MLRPKSTRSLVVLTIFSLVLGSCSGYKIEHEAEQAELAGNWDEAVVRYLELTQKDPANLTYRSALLRAKIQASHFHFEQGKEFKEAGILEEALVEMQQAVQLDPTNQYAYSELIKVRDELDALREERDFATSLDVIKDRNRGAMPQLPVLDPRSDTPIDLDFPEPVSVLDIYRALGKAFGINVLFDPDLRDEAVSVELKQVDAETALDHLIGSAGHFYKVLDEHSIIIAADTQQNRRKYTDLIIQTFPLSNSDVSEVMAMLRTLIDSRKVAANERLNAVVLRDSADKVKIAERLIRSNDKARAEVVIDVELMQVDTNKLRDIGLSLQPRAIGWQVGDPNAGGGDTGTGQLPSASSGSGSTVRLSDLEFLNASNWFVTIPSFLLTFVKDNTEAQTLARPQLRISEGEAASLVIGDQVPIPVTSFNSANTVGGNIVPITSFQYQDVGITIEIEPRVHHNNEVSLELRVVVSNVSGNVGQQPIIGTREINTVIRLKDGETNFLAGLIRTDETVAEQEIPGLGSIPLIGRLFSRKRTETKRTDIVLTLTPHIIRRADFTEEDLLPMWIGTETNFGVRGSTSRIDAEDDGPFDEESDDEMLDALERRRERLRQLPAGLREGVNVRDELDGDEDSDDDGSRGVELVPSRPPLNNARIDSNPTRGIDPVAIEPSAAGPLAAPSEGVAFAAPASPDVEVSVTPSRGSVLVGQEFEVAVRLLSRRPVSHLPMTLSFDPQVLAFEGWSAGTFLPREGTSLLVDSGDPGRVIIGASRLGAVPGVEGEGELMKLRFRAISAGRSTVDFEKIRVLDSELAPLTRIVAEGSSLLIEEGASRPTTPQRRPRPDVDP